MSRNVWEIIVDAADECQIGTPSTTSAPTLAQLVRWANLGKDQITAKTKCLQKLITFSTVDDQSQYDLGSTFIDCDYVEYIQATANKYRLKFKPMDEYREYQAFRESSSSPAEIYTVWDNKLLIYPAPSASANADTLSGNHTATVTTLTLSDASGFPSRGRVIVESEVIEYTGSTSTTLTGCTRGVEGTTAATHADTTAITERDLWSWSRVQNLNGLMKVYNTGTATFTAASTALAGTSTYWVANAKKGDYAGTGASPTKWYEISSVTDNTNAVLTTAFGEATATGAAYVIASPLEIPDYYSEALTVYIKSRIMKWRDEDEDAARFMREFNEMLMKLKMDIETQGDDYRSLN